MYEDARLIDAAWDDVQRAGKNIVEGVYLPSIGETESKHRIVLY
jgi:hypothetical protein